MTKGRETEWTKTFTLQVEVNRLRAEVLKLRGLAEKRDPTAEAIRQQILKELRKLTPEAIKQARKGKPALLRLIARAVK